MTLDTVSRSLRSVAIKVIGVAVVAATVGTMAGIASVYAEELYLLEDQDGEQWYNSTGGSTRVLFGSGYGDKGVTHSYFAVQGVQGNEYYTSWPD